MRKKDTQEWLKVVIGGHRRRRKCPFPSCYCVSLEIRREKPAQEQARVFSRNSPPLTSGGSLWAGEVVTGKTTPERKGEALSLIYAFLLFVIQPTIARHKCRKWVQKLPLKLAEMKNDSKYNNFTEWQ